MWAHMQKPMGFIRYTQPPKRNPILATCSTSKEMLHYSQVSKMKTQQKFSKTHHVGLFLENGFFPTLLLLLPVV